MPNTIDLAEVTLASEPDVVRAMRAWHERATAGGTVGPDEGACGAFPFAAVHDHFNRTGKGNVDTACLVLLDQIERDVQKQARGTAEPPSWTWFLGRWLPMLVDVHRFDCTYATYVGTYFYDDLVRPRLDGPPACTPDVLVTVLLADLLLAESTSLLAMGGSDGTPLMHLRARRVTTLATALSHNRADLLQRDEVLPLWPAARRKGDKSHRADAEAGKRLAERFLAVVPPRLHRFAQLALVPATDVYDEPMFLRVLQLFETMFGVVLGLAASARDDLVAGRTEAAVGQLESARVTLGRAIPFFRILATMPKESFAVIRQFTAGASGLQSESFKAIEVLCAQQPGDRLAGPGYEAPVVARLAAVEQVTLDAAIRQALPSLDPGLAHRLVSCATELDHEWLQWKRTHWAIANRLIGDVPGTGGTDGATYLRRHMSGPLLPFLHEEDD